MKRQDLIFDETKLNLSFDEDGHVVWSFKAVKEGVPCEKVNINFLSSSKQRNNRNTFSRKKMPLFITVQRVAESILPRRMKNALIDVLYRPISEEPNDIPRYRIQYHNIVRKFAKKGFLDEHFHLKVIELSKLFGFKPRDYDLHHKTPVSWGGDNKPENITLIQNKLHCRLHQLTTNLIYKVYEQNKAKLSACAQSVMMPVLPPVLTKKNIARYFNGFDDLVQPRQRETAPLKVPNKEKRLPKTIRTAEQNTPALRIAASVPHTTNNESVQPLKAAIAERIKKMRECGQLPPAATKGTLTARLVKKAPSGYMRRTLGRHR